MSFVFQQKSLCHIALRGSRCVYATFLLCICYHRSLIQACGLYAGCSSVVLSVATQHTHTQMPWKPLKASLFSAAYLQYYLIHYSICIVDKMSNPKTNAGTLCRVIPALCGSRFQLNGIHVWVSLKEASRVRRDAFILERFDPHCLDLF